MLAADVRHGGAGAAEAAAQAGERLVNPTQPLSGPEAVAAMTGATTIERPPPVRPRPRELDELERGWRRPGASRRGGTGAPGTRGGGTWTRT